MRDKPAPTANNNNNKNNNGLLLPQNYLSAEFCPLATDHISCLDIPTLWFHTLQCSLLLVLGH